MSAHFTAGRCETKADAGILWGFCLKGSRERGQELEGDEMWKEEIFLSLT